MKGIISFIMTLTVIAIIVIVALSVLIYYETSHPTYLIQDILNNHNTPLVYDFEEDENCPRERRLISNIFYPGTVPGCKCPNDLKLDICNKRDIYCYDVSKTYSKDLLFWKEKPICIKYGSIKENNFISYNKLWQNAVQYGQRCKEGFRKCGLLDTTNNVLCIRSNLPCPITKILVSDSLPNSDNNLFKFINIKNNTFFTFSNEEINTQINIEFKAFEEHPCVFSNELYHSTNGIYLLEKAQINNLVTKCSDLTSQTTDKILNRERSYEYDSRFNLIDSESKYYLYKDNTILPIIETLPGYPINGIKDISINLYSRSYIGVKRSCQESGITPQLIQSKLKKSNEIHFMALILIIISSILFITALVTIINYQSLDAFVLRLILVGIVTFGLYYFTNEYLFIHFTKSVYECLDDTFAEILGFIEEQNKQVNSIITYLFISLYSSCGLFTLLLLSLLFIGSSGRERLFSNEDNENVYHKVD